MARLVARDTLRGRIRQRANLENHTSFIPDSEINDVIDEVITEFWDLLVQSAPPDYFSTEATYTTSDGDMNYPLPADFYKARAVWVDEGNDERRPLAMFNEQEFQVYRPPDGEYSVILRYVPNFTTLGSDDATINGVNGFDELVVLAGAIKLLIKEGARLDLVQLLMAERARQEARISAMAERNPGEAQRVVRRSLRMRDPFRTWTNTINAYAIVGSNLQIVRASGLYAI